MISKLDLIKKMRGIEDGIGSAHVLLVATGSTMDLASERIWGRGELTDGGVLRYSGPSGRGFYFYAPPFPKKGNGKGKPYEDWLVRPESINERKQAIDKSIRRLQTSLKRAVSELNRRKQSSYSNTKTIRELEERINRLDAGLQAAERKKSAFTGRFGSGARKIKGTYAASYKDAKDAIGRGDTPFELTGDLRKNWLGGVAPTPNEETPFLCTISVDQESKDKIDGLTETKGEFIKFSASEIEAHHGHVLEAYRELVLNVQ